MAPWLALLIKIILGIIGALQVGATLMTYKHVKSLNKPQ
jgi:hypothetical protein